MKTKFTNGTLSPEVRAAILAKDKNHPWGKDGFCTLCHNIHRTDFRPNDLCPVLMKNLTNKDK